MVWNVWYEHSLSWTPTAEACKRDLQAWWAMLATLERPTRLVINTVVHRCLQAQALVWPDGVHHVDTVLSALDSSDGLTAWQQPPASWGWLWRAGLNTESWPCPSEWPESPVFKAEMVAHPDQLWPHARSWWLRWQSCPERQAIALEVWLDEREGLTSSVVHAWDRWQSQIAPLARRSGWPAKPWVSERQSSEDPRWHLERHRRWDQGVVSLDTPAWAFPLHSTISDGRVAPCRACSARATCSGPYMPNRWATDQGVCTLGRGWRVRPEEVRP